ncbi:hypothetical protein TRFO_13613 [Tritrichomonas foetus]|uniref:Uncharacterized protein n=1 Tax=Tritrichomonas foetus TaxID=1144522 RepID=A0A1J4KXG1_9EUKA|nr:hypothetical protein TRFO_13613 [Tritrichomonas foetus]|eukprot:OHT15939.1 hypothetical protein TRFO_13613 [Tritrichomonas foetus]
MMFSVLLYLSISIIPKDLKELADKARENARLRRLMTEDKVHMINHGSYEKKGIKFRISKSLLGPPAKEIKGHACNANYLALIPNIKYEASRNLSNSAFAHDQKMYLLNDIVGFDDTVTIYHITEIDPRLVITEVIMFPTDDKTEGSETESTITKSLNFNWNSKENMPVFRQINPSFPNLKFEMGTEVKASASAKLHSRGTNYLQLTLTLKIEGSYGAGIQTIAGRSEMDDIALYGAEFQIWGTSLILFGFEFKTGLFSYIDASIADISLDTAVNFTFVHGYNFEAYNKIVVCTGFPAPGYITTGWQSNIEKIDNFNDASQNGSQTSYETTLKFSPRVDIGVKLGVEMPNIVESWLRAGIRGEVNFKFGADPVSCDFPYLYGTIEPEVSLFVGYDGLKLLNFEVAPAFETKWVIFKKTIYNKECAFIDVKVSPEYENIKIFKMGHNPILIQFDSLQNLNLIHTLSYINSNDQLISAWEPGKTNNFKPIIFYDSSSINEFECAAVYKTKSIIDGKEVEYYISTSSYENLNDKSGNITAEFSKFIVKYNYKEINGFYSGHLIFCDSDEIAFKVDGRRCFALIQADMTGGFSLLDANDVEFWDDATPNDGWQNSGFPNPNFFISGKIAFYAIETLKDRGLLKLDVYIKYKEKGKENYFCTIMKSNVGESIIKLITKDMGPDVIYKFYLYINENKVHEEELYSEWLSYKRDRYILYDGIYLRQIGLSNDMIAYAKIKNKNLVGPKRYSFVPCIDIDGMELYGESKFHVETCDDNFLIRISEYNLYDDPDFHPELFNTTIPKFAIFLKCPDCFPICKHCETIEKGYYLIKLVVNDTIVFTKKNTIIQIPMHSTIDYIDTQFEITHFILLNNEGSSICTNNTYLNKSIMGYKGNYYSYS